MSMEMLMRVFDELASEEQNLAFDFVKFLKNKVNADKSSESKGWISSIYQKNRFMKIKNFVCWKLR